MKVHYDLSKLPRFNNAVITIGSYDGVHAGHQQIVKRLNSLAREIDGVSVIITFHPHPRLVVYPNDNSLRLITDIEEKTAIFSQLGVDHLVVAPFTKEFSQQTPDDYIEHFLVDKFKPKKIVIGYDHRFGNKRAGNIDYLKKFEATYGYTVEEISKQKVDDMAVSSTKVRNALLFGDVRNARQLLKHPFSIKGTVEKGKQIGRGIGYPTANLRIENRHKMIPADGIYAVFVKQGAQQHQGMLYIGKSLDNAHRTLEVNIFDFNQNIYDEELTLTFIDFIREDERFDSMEKLKLQLQADKEKALSILSKVQL